MTDKKSNDSRRKLLKSAVVGSGVVVAGKSLPESWSKPVVNAVMLPAHAATTEATTTPTPLPTSYSGDLDFGSRKAQNNPLDSVLSVLVQDAHAAPTAEASSGSMCVDTSNAPTFTAKVLLSDERRVMKELYEEDPISGFYETKTGIIGSMAGVDLLFKGGCNFFGTVNVAIASIDANGANYKVTVTNDGAQVASGSASEGTDCPEEPIGCVFEPM